MIVSIFRYTNTVCVWKHNEKGSCKLSNGSIQHCEWKSQQFSCRMGSIEEIMDVKPPKYLSNYASPCWVESLNLSDLATDGGWEENSEKMNAFVSQLYRQTSYVFQDYIKYHEKDRGVVQRVRCLPYFYVIGVAKSGTTDLFVRMKEHPYIEAGIRKEIHYWSRRRFGRSYRDVTVLKPSSLKQYSELFDGAAQKSQSLSIAYYKNSKLQEYHPLMIGEGSVSTLHDNHEWKCLKENICSDEPRLTTPSYIMHIQPQARFIAILRDPVSRLYSDYHFFNPPPHSPEDFHSRVVRSLSLFKNCTLGNSLRFCAYDVKLFQNSPVDLKLGLYTIFISDWLKVVPRDQMHFLATQVWSSNRQNELNKIFNFLGLESSSQMEITDAIANVNTKETRAPMLRETQTLLKTFFIPYNQQLSKLLNDDSYLYGYS